MVTGYDSWVLYGANAHRALWLQLGEDPPTQPKSDLNPRNALLCCFWDARGMLYYEVLPQGQTINASIYAGQLRKLVGAVEEKRPRRTCVHLLHDIARPHVAKLTQSTLAELGWDTIPHPPYSPDIAASDYHLFRPLKAHPAKKTYSNLDDVISGVADSFDSCSTEFWTKGTNDIPIK